jgi:hypothetical protein
MKIRNLAFSAAGMALFALASFAQITGVEGTVKGTRLARRREVSHPARSGLVLVIRAACPVCVLPSDALLLIECLVLRTLREGRPASLRTVGYQPGGRRLAGRPLYVRMPTGC